jgi:hypothetical protein
MCDWELLHISMHFFLICLIAMYAILHRCVITHKYVITLEYAIVYAHIVFDFILKRYVETTT